MFCYMRGCEHSGWCYKCVEVRYQALGRSIEGKMLQENM